MPSYGPKGPNPGQKSPAGTSKLRSGEALLAKSNNEQSRRRSLFPLPLPLTLTKRADEELVDQKKYLEDSCKPKCVKPLLEYEACVKRVEGDDSGHKHCTGQYFDYWFCVDKCVAPKLLSKLK